MRQDRSLGTSRGATGAMAAGDYQAGHDKDPHRLHLACDHAVNIQLLQLGGAFTCGSGAVPCRDHLAAWLLTRE